ncbi:MAG: proline--tRNA ligase [Sandaracinus sp.]|nr:proline--tRNA ligase [Sandaracinus sp.]MCB9618514.1 proline--tRNA ligase [Sandaracinus sp.]MCB9622076.1 proline--tRNA ligase [Sandaracinus sp.]MCB9630633.1 proline--tRNA ligase [Sandaracinus sp.]
MRYSQAFLPTIKEVPKDAVDASHVLLLRGGYIRMVGAGIYEMLPLGQRVLKRVQGIIRREMDAAGAQEVLMPAILPATYFQETGRYDLYGPVLLRLKDRKGGEYHLGPTHEEIITDMVRREVKSYRQLPINLYQIQMKYRDEARPRAGLMRCREFMMKDAYSFDVSEEKAFESYAIMREAYHRIFKSLGLDYRIVQADSGQIGGKTSAEFQVLAQSGEDRIVACTQCDYAANVEVAEARIDTTKADFSATPERLLVKTPKTKSIEQVVAFFAKDDAPKSADGAFGTNRILKTLAYLVPSKGDKRAPDAVATADEIALVVVRGDHEVNEILVARALGVEEVHLASEADVKAVLGVGPGFVGPVAPKSSLRTLVDHAAAAVADGVCGANQWDHHFAHVAYGRDFEGEVLHLRLVGAGDECPKCGGKLEAYRGIEGGHIFVLGTHYSSQMKATFLDENGESKPFVMGCYGIGVTRLMASAIEQHHDADGIRWPISIAPYQATVLGLGNEPEVTEAAEKLYLALKKKGVDVLFDDRQERPGVKFKDADLVGIPLRISIGKRGLAEGKAEVKLRTEKDATMVALEEAADVIAAKIVELGGKLS